MTLMVVLGGHRYAKRGILLIMFKNYNRWYPIQGLPDETPDSHIVHPKKARWDPLPSLSGSFHPEVLRTSQAIAHVLFGSKIVASIGLRQRKVWNYPKPLGAAFSPCVCHEYRLRGIFISY